MEKTMPLTRMQQAVGFPEHPCEAILRNSFLIAPYEEMEVQFFENHCGLYHVALAGEPFAPIGFSPRTGASQRYWRGIFPSSSARPKRRISGRGKPSLRPFSRVVGSLPAKRTLS